MNVSHFFFHILKYSEGQRKFCLVFFLQKIINHLPDIPTFNDPEEEDFLKHCGKRRKCW